MGHTEVPILKTLMPLYEFIFLGNSSEANKSIHRSCASE